jgi:uncharacterized protein YndB with AHSA1/START domain
MTNEVHERHKTSITTPSDTEIRIERIFDAPVALVWEAYTDPELFPEWLGPRELSMTVDEFDFRPGGSYRFRHRDSEGNEFVFFGGFSEVEEPGLIVRTFAWEGMPGKQSVERAEFEELDATSRRGSAGASRAENRAPGSLRTWGAPARPRRTAGLRRPAAPGRRGARARRPGRR